MNKQETLTRIFQQAVGAGLARTQKDFAMLLGVNRNVLSAALNGDEKYLTDRFLKKVIQFIG